MQKFIRVNGDKVDEINLLLEKGWKVLDFKCISRKVEQSFSASYSYAYVLLEKN